MRVHELLYSQGKMSARSEVKRKFGAPSLNLGSKLGPKLAATLHSFGPLSLGFCFSQQSTQEHDSKAQDSTQTHEQNYDRTRNLVPHIRPWLNGMCQEEVIWSGISGHLPVEHFSRPFSMTVQTPDPLDERAFQEARLLPYPPPHNLGVTIWNSALLSNRSFGHPPRKTSTEQNIINYSHYIRLRSCHKNEGASH